MWGIISNDINFYCVLRETRNGLFAYPKGRPGPERTHCTPIPCSDDIENRVRQIRSNNGIIDITKMLVLLSLASNEVIKFMCMYPEVWFMDCTSGESSSLVLQIHFVSTIFYGDTILTSRTITCLQVFLSPNHTEGTNREKKDLFVVAVHSAGGDTLPVNLTVIPSGQKRVFEPYIRPHLLTFILVRSVLWIGWFLQMRINLSMNHLSGKREPSGAISNSRLVTFRSPGLSMISTHFDCLCIIYRQINYITKHIEYTIHTLYNLHT